MQPDAPENTVSEELVRMLALSEKFDEDVFSLLKAGWNTSTQRVAISMAYCKSAIEHPLCQYDMLQLAPRNQ